MVVAISSCQTTEHFAEDQHLKRITELDSKIDKLQNKLDSKTLDVENIKLYQSFYTTNLKTQTGIYSIIVSLAIFIIGWVIPKHTQKQIDLELKRIEQNSENRIDSLSKKLEIQKSVNKEFLNVFKINQKKITTEKFNRERHNCRTMYHIGSQQEDDFVSFIWSLRLVQANIFYNKSAGCDKNEKIELTSEYLKYCDEYFDDLIVDVDKKNEISELPLYFDEIEELLKNIQNNLTFENDIALIKKLKNKIYKKHFESIEI